MEEKYKIDKLYGSVDLQGNEYKNPLLKKHRTPGRCKGCRWWGPRKPFAVEGGGLPKFKILFCEKSPYSVREMLADNVASFEGYDHDILTGPDFGCIHWEGINLNQGENL